MPRVSLPKYRCWLPLDGHESEDDGKDVEAYDHQGAAEKYIERRHADDPWTDIECDRFVIVRGPNPYTDEVVTRVIAVGGEQTIHWGSRPARKEDLEEMDDDTIKQAEPILRRHEEARRG